MDKLIETRHGPLHARVEGEGPAVVLAHGYDPASTWRVWENNLAALAGAGFRAYALDLIGYGESVGERLGAPEQAEAILDLVEAEDLAPAVLAGVSWGGMVALEAALAAPAAVARLVLVCSAGVGHFSEQQMQAIACPALVVWGEDDTVLPVAHAAWFGAAIPGCRVEVIAGVTEQEGVPDWGGHHPMRFKPGEFNPILLEFLRTS